MVTCDICNHFAARWQQCGQLSVVTNFNLVISSLSKLCSVCCALLLLQYISLSTDAMIVDALASL